MKAEVPGRTKASWRWGRKWKKRDEELAPNTKGSDDSLINPDRTGHDTVEKVTQRKTPIVGATSVAPLERSPRFSSAAAEEKWKDGGGWEKKLFIEGVRGGGVCRRFRILDHRHGDQSPGNRVHNGSGRRGNSVVSGGGRGGGGAPPGRQVDGWSDGETSARWRAGRGEMEEEEQVRTRSWCIAPQQVRSGWPNVCKDIMRNVMS